MFALNRWLSSLPAELYSLFDATLLALITTPFLYYFLVKPISDLVIGLQSAKDELKIMAQAFMTGEAIIITDSKLNILRVNKAFENITGFKELSLIGKALSKITSTQYFQSFKDDISPALVIHGSWFGESVGLKKSGIEFPMQMSASLIRDASENLMQYVFIFTDITDRKENEYKVFQLAYFDLVTSLPNRQMLLIDIDKGAAKSEISQEYGALLVLESDNSEFLAESGKFLENDVFLEKIALELSAELSEGFAVYKTRGNEFAVLVAGLGKDSIIAHDNINKIVDIINVVFSSPFVIADRKYYSSVSIGITVFLGRQFLAQDLLESTNIALHSALNLDGNSVVFYDVKYADEIKEKLALEQQLHDAPSNGELEFYYQLQVDGQQKPIGAEALVRWNHKELGLVSPITFIPIAEKGTLIEEIGNHLLELAFKELIEWSQYDETRELTLSVNVSAKQFYRPQFALTINDLFEKYPIDPSKLTLELTESISAANLSYISKTMFSLKRDFHIKLSLDDYGTGYSSLGYLQKMPFDEIKIDQRFVKNITSNKNDASLVDSIIDLAKIYNFEVVAEGVETVEQFNYLKTIGCQIFQGYLFSKPLPSAQFRSLLNVKEPSK